MQLLEKANIWSINKSLKIIINKVDLVKASLKDEFYTIWSVGRNEGIEIKQKGKRPAKVGK